MGRPVVHFEVVGKDGARLREYYSELFDWEIDANNPIDYGLITRESNPAPDGMGIGGGIGQCPEGEEGHLTFYVAVDDIEAALQKAEGLGGTRVMGPQTIPDMVELGLFKDPEGNLVGVVKPVEMPS